MLSANNPYCYFNKNSNKRKSKVRAQGAHSMSLWSNLMLSIAIATTPEESEGWREPPPPVDHNQWVPNAEPELTGCDFHHFFRKNKTPDLSPLQCFEVLCKWRQHKTVHQNRIVLERLFIAQICTF